jgi:transglutaminase-like putative cysteine protease
MEPIGNYWDLQEVRQGKMNIRRESAGYQTGIFIVLIGVPLLLMVAAVPTVPRKRTVDFTYKTVVSDIPAGADVVDIWLPVPKNSPFQQITDLSVIAPYPYTIETGQFGNKLLHLRLAKPTVKSIPIEMRFTATRQEHIQSNLRETNAGSGVVREPGIQLWLKPDRLVPVDATIRRWAKAVVDSVGAKTDLQKAKAIYNHVISTVKYDKTGMGWGRGDIYYACDTRRGNCTDFHAIFIGYCRAVDIPARFAIGFSLPTERPAGAVSGYHCWAEFYLNGVGWVPVDASEAAKNPDKRAYFFGAHDENRIEFSIGRDLVLHKGQPQPLNYLIYPYVEMDGQSVLVDSKTFTYQNVPIP